MGDAIVLPFPEPIPIVRNVRSTLLIGGVESLRAAGLGDAYDAGAPPEVQSAISTAVAGMWLPIDIAVAHYLWCDTLGLSNDSAAQLGRSTFERTKGTLLGAATALARGSGVDPWTFMPHLNRFWLRGLDGGGMRAVKKGPKEVEVHVAGCPLNASKYFRGAMRGLFAVLLELVCDKAYVHERPFGDPATSVAMRAQWV